LAIVLLCFLAGMAVIPSLARSMPRNEPSPAAALTTGSQAELAGTWQRDEARSDHSYFMREYPGMTLEIQVAGIELDVRVSLGTVRGGVALPGSGEEFLDYTLVADGEVRDVASPTSARRTASAQWVDESLRVHWHWVLGGAEERKVEVIDNWTVIDGGSALRINRRLILPERSPSEDMIVFRRIE
jgi:hypothetical protein